ncbi:THO complex subunit 1 transcription elongation factor-domain-containing protein [Irpex rosettiformis]|uniref:THO complex subunit 1 transcription elongation factor-domain-containing protein n=1 Tax=Irpex rosettiformis TaxID=378272 RepID=A0ACB8UL89_9APHY|nr:THO complex subunit 1 transcription elongation factor-domain-containing protein [Irpex rosettiformis]
MQAVQDALNRIIGLLPQLIRRDALDEHVLNVLASLDQNVSSEARKTQWEFVLRQEIFTLAATEGLALKNPATTYYEDLTNHLDLVLALTDKDACEQTFPFNIIYDLLETQTISSCSHIFSWIELRAGKLTAGMIPQKGKALILLRTLNDLLRRLSKTGSTTLFCGRILTFLSQVFPLGERSGVNLRGEYGPAWEGPGLEQDVPQPKKTDEDVKMDPQRTESTGDVMQVDESEKKEGEEEGETKLTAEELKQQQKDGTSKDIDPFVSLVHQLLDFYRTFWSLQLPFSKPTVFVKSGTFTTFQGSVNKILPVIKEATAKERALMGSKSNSNSITLKRRREPEVGLEAAGQDYFFAKYLTSPDLLDLEIADTHFRRQFLFQLLILLHHLLTFTEAAKTAWVTPRNRSLQMDFTLKSTEAQWVQETMHKVSEELRQTTPSGRAFAETVYVILEREKNWVKWKSELCAPFDKMPWAEEIEAEVNGLMQKEKVGIEEATHNARKKRREKPEPWPHELGSEPLTEIWLMGYRDLTDLQHPFHPGDVQDYVKKVKLEDVKIENRRKQLAKTAERMAAARAKATAAASVSALTASPAPGVASQDNSQSPIPASNGPKPPTPSVPPATPPLHPSLPAKPGTAPVKTPAPATPEPVSIPIVAPIPTIAPTPTPVVEVVPPPDDLILQYEENKQRWSWLALRTARDQYLQHFGKIGTGDVLLLAQEIEKEKADKERALRGELPRPEHRTSADRIRKRLLVTGGAGYIGSHVIHTLQETRQYKVISIDNLHNAHARALARVEQLARNSLPVDATERDRESTVIDSHTADLTKPDQLRAVFDKYGKGGIWGVIHIAAYKAVGESTQIPLTYYENNVVATVYLLQVMNEFDCHKIVYSSSATVYGTPPTIPIPETTRLQADSPYGKTKVMCETILQDLTTSDSKWRAISLRYFNPAGAHPSGLIGEEPKGRPGNLLPLLAHMACGRVKDAKLHVFGNDYPTPDGTCVRDYLHILDLARGHTRALEVLTDDSTIFDNCPTQAHFKAYNLGKGKGMSVLQIVEAMRKATGFDYKYEFAPRRHGDVPDLTADPTLAEKELGFEAPQDLETMCKDLWNWQSKNPYGYDEAPVKENGANGSS